MEDLDYYFKKYAEAYLLFDPSALVPFFYCPCIVHDLKGIRLLNNKQEICDYLRPFLNQLRRHDVQNIKSIVRNINISENLPGSASCIVAYLLHNAKGNTVLDFDYEYQLYRKDNLWRILFARIDQVRIMEFFE